MPLFYCLFTCVAALFVFKISIVYYRNADASFIILRMVFYSVC